MTRKARDILAELDTLKSSAYNTRRRTRIVEEEEHEYEMPEASLPRPTAPRPKPRRAPVRSGESFEETADRLIMALERFQAEFTASVQTLQYVLLETRGERRSAPVQAQRPTKAAPQTEEMAFVTDPSVVMGDENFILDAIASSTPLEESRRAHAPMTDRDRAVVGALFGEE